MVKTYPKLSALLFTLATLSIAASSQAQVNVPANLAVNPPLTTAGGNLRGEYWKRPTFSIPTDGATNPTNRIDKLIESFGSPDGTFRASRFVYLGNDLTHITNWLAADAATFVGATNNLDDGAVRFSGFINITNASTLNVGTTSDDGSRITIAGIDVINNDSGHGDATVDTNVVFAAAGLYPIEITFFNGDWTSDGAGANLNHSGNPDPSVHGGANFHLRVGGADITAAQASRLLYSTAPVVLVPANLVVNPPLTTAGGNLRGEYWKRPPVSIPTDGATNPTNRIDNLLSTFGPPNGTFQARSFVYLGNDLTHITNWLAGDAASFAGATNSLDDGAIRLSGFINVTNAGSIRLGTTSDDGSRITIGGIDVINNDGSHGDVTIDTNVNFRVAGLYPIEITFWNGDWTSDGTGANLNHSGNPDPSVHGGANFHLRLAGADITTTGASRLLYSTAPVILVPPTLAVSPPLKTAGGAFKGEYWKRPPVSIPTDGATNPTNRIDNLVIGFGAPDGIFQAKRLVYLGNDLTHITNWLASDADSFIGATNNLDDGAFRFTGYINVAAPGSMSLGTVSDDGSRIKIGGIDVINNDGSHGDATIDTNVNFRVAGLYPIEITFWNGDWTSDGTGANLNHSGNPDPSVHGGANFHLRVSAADVTAARAAMFHPPRITRVVETGGDNEATDTISARWTGYGFPVSVANEPVPGLAVGNKFNVGFFGNHAPAFVDRNHRFTNAAAGIPIPSYLVGGEYIMSGNDNRDNASYRLDVTVSQPVQAYMLIDNRLADPNKGSTNPPVFGPTKMQWILDEGWAAVLTGKNRAGNAAFPDEIGIDEGADGTINQWYSIYTKAFPAGTFQLKQPDNGGQNMYGVVITPPAAFAPAVPELDIARQGANIVISFPSGTRLQHAASLNAPVTWTDVSSTSPYTVPSGAAAGFYRGISP